ncbi:MAG: FG-GAP-like repeat-containing protein [Blastocatellia bacterium]
MNKHLFLGRYISVVLVVGFALVARLDILHRGEGITIAAQTPSCGAGANLQGIRQIATAEIVRAVASGDFNGDGNVDLATSEIILNLPISRISLWFGDGQGGFENVINFQVNGAFLDLDTGDLNGDGRLDLVGSSNAAFGPDAGVIALLGNGDGTFQLANSVPTGPPTQFAIAVADLNGDGRADVAVTNQPDRSVFVALSAADGKLGAPVKYQLTTAPFTIAAADFNGDGKNDLVTANPNSPMLTLLANNGSGGFSVASNPDTGGNNNSVTVGDFNGDGKTDIATAQATSIATLIGDGSGGFSPAKKIGNKGGGAIIAEDLSGDGKDDLVLGGATIIALFNDGAGNFGATVTYGAGTTTTAFVAGDFNGDGKTDLAATGENSEKVSILLNANGSALQAPNVSEPSLFPSTLNVGDLNKDGKPDLVVTNNLNFEVSFGDGKGSFGARRRFDSLLDLSGSVAAVQLGDFNKDGNADLAFTGGSFSSATGSVIVAFADASGNFNAARTKKVAVGSRPADLLTADFNGDGALDLAAANAASNDVSLLLGNGRGDFIAAPVTPVGLEPGSLAAADFNGDGKTDLAVANRNSAVLTVLLGDGQGSFNTMFIGLGANPREVKTGDVNGDGKADLIVSQNNAGLVSVFLGNGNGGFAAPVNAGVGGIPYSLALADYNADGKLDLAVTRFISRESTEGRAQLFFGNGAGRFSAASELLAPMVRQISAADLNGDGLNDLVFVSLPSGGGGNIYAILAQCNPPPAPNTLANVSAASFRRFFLASESIVAAFGAGLSAETAVANTVPLPTQLAGTIVKVKDSAGVERLSPLFFVSPNQINYQMPPGTATGSATVTVTSTTGNTVTSATQIAAVAPGIFTANSNGRGPPAGLALRLQPDGRQIFEPLARFDPESNQFVPAPINLSVLGPTIDQVFLILFGTGMRPGAGATVEARIGGRGMRVLYAGPQGDFIGVDQINIEILRGFLQPGEHDVSLTINGRVANTVRISLGN